MYHPIYENLSMECKKHGISITALCAEITGSSGNLATWKKGKICANDLLSIKDKLNISIDDILINYNPSSLEQFDTDIDSNESSFMTKTVQRILKLMEQNGDNAHSLEKKACLPKSSIAGWKNDKYKPSTDAIIKLARYFNISANYLLCLSNEPTPLKTADIMERPAYALSTELAELLQDKRFVNSAKLYKAMTDEYKQEICSYILGIAVGLGLNVQQILGS